MAAPRRWPCRHHRHHRLHRRGADRWRLAGGPVAGPLVMVGAHVLALSADALLVLFPGPLLAVATLAMIGIGYGLVSGSAAAIGIYWGPRIMAGWPGGSIRLVRRRGHPAGGGGAGLRPDRRLCRGDHDRRGGQPAGSPSPCGCRGLPPARPAPSRPGPDRNAYGTRHLEPPRPAEIAAIRTAARPRDRACCPSSVR